LDHQIIHADTTHGPSLHTTISTGKHVAFGLDMFPSMAH
jgi:hypothetical protein